MSTDPVAEILPGLWRFEGVHPEWTADEAGEDGWEQHVASWVIARPDGFVLVDPLVESWEALDRLLAGRGGCAGIVRTCHWHERCVAEASRRYGVGVWAKIHPDGRQPFAVDHEIGDQAELFGGLRVLDVERADEIALWLPEQSALIFGDAMIRRNTGELRVCPESWTQPAGGPERLRALLHRLTELTPEHVLVSHGPLVLGDGTAALTSATS